ncbi:MAG: hypothetical protein KDB90_16310 [Planctomycetes bacterium]|nr:hypothetical protein [Planctomycetota bacterium]
MKRMLIAILAVACAGLGGLLINGHDSQPVVIAQDAQPEKIKNIEAHLKADEAYQKADLAGRLGIIAEMLKAKTIDWSQARGTQMREMMTYARAHEMDPDKNLVALVTWLGAESKDYKGAIRTASNNTGALAALIETYGAQRLYKDETFLKGDSQAKLARIKELWEARELDQGQCYELTAMYIYEHLAPANGDIDKQIKMFGELNRAKCMDWAGSASVHDALLTRALETKKDLDTVEKKLAWIGERTSNKDGDLSWMVVGRRRLTLFMHVLDGTMSGLGMEERAAKIDEYQKKDLISSSDASDLNATYCERK